MQPIQQRRQAWGTMRAQCWQAYLVGLLWVLCVSLAPLPAFAHAALISTQPVDGAVLAQAPQHISLTFSEPVSPLALKLVNPDGSSQALKSFRLDGETLRIDAPPQLGAGTHVLSWRVISTDGHPIGGASLFSIGGPSAAPVAAQSVDWPLRGSIWLARILLYVGLFVGAGGAFALCWLSPEGRSCARPVNAALLGGIVAAIVSLGLQGVDALGLSLSGLSEPIVWRTAFETTYGSTVLISVAALAFGLLSRARASGPFAKTLSLLALGGVGAALAASGHASAAQPQWLTRPMVFLHGVGIAFWAGALIPLAFALKLDPPAAEPFLRRFSKTILPIVGVLAVAGIVLAIIQVQTPSALVATAYGRLLLVKLGLLAILFALAAYNRWRLTGAVEGRDSAARRKLVRSAAIESLVVLAIFGVAAGWRFTPPPRALAIAAAQPVSMHVHTLKAMADVSISPGHAGPVTASVVIMTGDFGPLDARELTLVLSKPDSGIEPLKRPARKAGDGTWRVDGLVIPVPGKWTLGLDILITDFEAAKIEGTVEIRP